MRQQPWGEAGGAHTQEVDKVFIGLTRALIVSRGLTTKRVSDSLGVPKFTAIKFVSAPFPACYLLPFHSHELRREFPSSGRMLPTNVEFLFFLSDDSPGIRPWRRN